MDLLVIHRGKFIGFEMKLADAPTVTKSMKIAIEDLKLARLFVVCPGRQSYPLDENIDVVSIAELPKHLASLNG